MPRHRCSAPACEPCVFYTDGSANATETHLERHVAWAIVRDVGHVDAGRQGEMPDLRSLFGSSHVGSRPFWFKLLGGPKKLVGVGW